MSIMKDPRSFYNMPLLGSSNYFGSKHSGHKRARNLARPGSTTHQTGERWLHSS